MAGNRTLTIIKPDAFASGKSGLIIAHLEKAGFKIIS
jgi:nucleoside-diphosphate kinase